MIKETSEATQSLTRAVVLSNESIAARVDGLQERVEDEVSRVQKKVGEDIQEVQDQLSVIEKAHSKNNAATAIQISRFKTSLEASETQVADLKVAQDELKQKTATQNDSLTQMLETLRASVASSSEESLRLLQVQRDEMEQLSREVRARTEKMRSEAVAEHEQWKTEQATERRKRDEEVSEEIASVSEQVQTLESSLTERIKDSAREVESNQVQQLDLVKHTVAGVDEVVKKLAQNQRTEVQMLKSTLDSQRATVEKLREQVEGMDSEQQKEKIEAMATLAVSQALANAQSQFDIEKSISDKKIAEDLLTAAKAAAQEVLKANNLKIQALEAQLSQIVTSSQHQSSSEDVREQQQGSQRQRTALSSSGFQGLSQSSSSLCPTSGCKEV